MNTRILTVILITFCAASFAQPKRFFYEHRFADDSTNVNVNSKELMVLDIDTEGSRYYAFPVLAEDSLKVLKQTRPGRYPYQGIQNLDVIAKKYPSYEYNFYSSLGSSNYLIVYKKDLDWKLENESKKLNGYIVKKATAKLYNRKWVAWYAPDLPIQDGPYVFHGLPGLIIKIEDELKSQIFELTGIKNLKPYHRDYIPYYFDKRLITIDDKKWTNLLKDFHENPYAEDIADSSPNNTYRWDDGTVISKSEFFKRKEFLLKARRKKENNLLRFEFIR